MTETGPGASRVFDDPGLPSEERWRRRGRPAGCAPCTRPGCGVDEGGLLPCDGEAVGEIEVRGPMVIKSYFGEGEGSGGRFRDGWLRTGDLGSIDPRGWLTLVDREKDVVKSGGEWISSLDVEVALLDTRRSSRSPWSGSATIAGWSDPARVSFSVRRPSRRICAASCSSACRVGGCPSDSPSSMPCPRTGVGKLDKRSLRKLLEEGEIEAPVVS